MHRRNIALTVCSLLLVATPSAPFSDRAIAQDPASPTTALTQENYAGALETVATFTDAMPAGVTVSQEGRIFVTFPRWGDEVPFTVAEIVNGEAVAYPNLEINAFDGEAAEQSASDQFVSVQSVVVAPNNRLWALDAARIEFGEPPAGGPKLVEIDLDTNEVIRSIVLPSDVALPTSYLNDVRFDLSRGEAGMAFITDSSTVGDNGLIVVDLATEESWRKLNQHPSTLPEENFLPIVEGAALMNRPAEGEPSSMTIGADGIAIDAAGERLFYRVLSGRRLFSVDLDAIANRDTSPDEVAATVVDHGDLGFASDGLEADTDGRIYLTNYEDNAILTWQPDGTLETLIHTPYALWPDTLSLAQDGYLYFISNQLHRQAGFHNGEDIREKPYALYRVQTGASPVVLDEQ